MRWLTLAIGLAACAAPDAAPPGRDVATELRDYTVDPAVGRRALEASLVDSTNGYAKLRLTQYDEAHWGALPTLASTSFPIVDGSVPSKDDPRFVTLSEEASTPDELRALGERAFYTYPAQVVPGLLAAVARPDGAGLWRRDGAWGAVWARLPGGVFPAVTCASCHASVVGDRLVAGRNNPDLDAAFVFGVQGEWGLGRVDVTNDGIVNPVAIADLRPIAWQTNLHHAATLRNDPVALAVRIETLIVTNHRQSTRPSRTVAAALATYLLSLAPTTQRPSGRGADVFQRTCGGCHAGEGATGPAVRLDVVGTDPLVGESTERGTGHYRVPSLRGVGDRRRLFASGDVDGIEALLDPERTVAGHRYGLELGTDDRAALPRLSARALTALMLAAARWGPPSRCGPSRRRTRGR